MQSKTAIFIAVKIIAITTLINGLTPYDLYKVTLIAIGVFIIVSVLPEILRSIATIVTLRQQMQTEMIYNRKIAT